MSPRQRLILGIAAAAIGLGAVIALAFTGDPETPVPTLRVEKKPYLRQVTAEGNLKAVKATPISTPTQRARGPMKVAWILDDGDPVKAGDVIVRFDATDFERELTEGNEDRSKAGNRIAGAEASSGAVRTNLKRDAALAERELEAARMFEKKDAEIFSRYEVIESDINEGLAVEKKEYAEQMQFVRDQLFAAERGLLGIDERKANIRIERAKDGLTSLEIIAPHDGIIVLTRDWRGEIPRIGSSVWTGQPVGEIPDLSTMQVEAFVLEADAGGIAAGQEAAIVVESHPEKTFAGKVEKVEPIAKPRFRGSPVQYFGVTLTIEKTDPAIMKPGSRIRATITLEKEASAIAVPRQAIFDRDGKKIVYRKKGEAFEPVAVELGSAGVGAVLVKKGLAEGDVIALEEPEGSEQEGGS